MEATSGFGACCCLSAITRVLGSSSAVLQVRRGRGFGAQDFGFRAQGSLRVDVTTNKQVSVIPVRMSLHLCMAYGVRYIQAAGAFSE